MVGLFSAGRGEEEGKMGVSDEEEREGGKPGEGVRGVAGLEGGNEDGFECVSSAELSDSLRKWVYLVLGTSSMVIPQYQFLYPCKSTQAPVIQSKSLFQYSKFPSTGHTAVCPSASASELNPSVLRSVPGSLNGAVLKMASSRMNAG